MITVEKLLKKLNEEIEKDPSILSALICTSYIDSWDDYNITPADDAHIEKVSNFKKRSGVYLDRDIKSESYILIN